MVTKHAWKPSDEQRDLIERFEASYNAIDRLLRKTLARDRNATFVSLVAEFERDRWGWVDGEFLRMAADLRNAIVHQKTEPHQHVAVPTVPVVERIELVLQRLANPVRVMPKFAKPVARVSVGDSLAQVLRTIATQNFSQFPVYDGDRFKGLLTENGITRWMATHVASKFSLIELEDVKIREVLRQEESRPNWRFVHRGMTIDEVRTFFASSELLEAVFVTESGKPTERPLGIVTRWDILQRA